MISWAFSTQSSQDFWLIQRKQRKPEAMRVADGVRAKLHRSVSHKVDLQSSTRFSWHGFSRRPAQSFLYSSRSLGFFLSFTAIHRIFSAGQSRLASWFTRRSHSDHDVSDLHLKQWIARATEQKFLFRSVPVKLCETGRREAVLLVVCFLVIVHESENFYISCDKERFLLFYSKADFRILGKVSDIKCHLCRCPLKWTTCW